MTVRDRVPHDPPEPQHPRSESRCLGGPLQRRRSDERFTSVRELLGFHRPGSDILRSSIRQDSGGALRAVRSTRVRTSERSRFAPRTERGSCDPVGRRRRAEGSVSILNRIAVRKIRAKRSMGPPSSHRSLNFLRSRRTEITPGSAHYLGLEVRSDGRISHECNA